MNIKQRIDGLTEQEAKAVLGWYVTRPQRRCEFCKFSLRCNYSIKINSDACFDLIFDEALKEARI